MARIESETMADQGLVAVYIAKTLAEAQRVEEVLTHQGVDYVVQPELFARTLLGSARYGAMFYVTPGQARYCRSLLAVAGMELNVVQEEPDT